MNKVIVLTTLKLICPLIGVYSVFALLRGHNEPGGGFIGGLMLALSFILWILAFPNSRLRTVIENYFAPTIGVCLLLFIGVSLAPVFTGKEVLAGLWSSLPIPIAGKFSSVLVFDLIIYLVVCASFSFSFVMLKRQLQRDK